MSGILGVTAEVGGIGGAVSSILGLGQSDVTLGGFTFAGDGISVPGEMRWGAMQRTVRHVLPGGTVKIDLLGSDWPPIAWKGIFEGLGAADQAKTLSTMAKAGAQLTLTWLDRVFLVVIDRFTSTDITDGWVTYEISCQVVADADQIAGPPAPPSLGQQVISDLNDAAGFNVVDAAGQAATVISKAQQAAGLVGAFTRGTSSFNSLSTSAATAHTVVSGAVPLAGTAITNLGTNVSGATAGVNWVNGAATQTGNLAQASAASASTGRVVANLNQATT